MSSEPSEQYIYLKVEWTDAPESEAVLWYHEMNQDRMEIRKVVVFRERHSEWADETHETPYTWLSAHALPTFDDMAQHKGMKTQIISRSEFETAWRKAHFDAYPD